MNKESFNSSMVQSRGARSAFTLIEMLVVVALTVAIATAGFLGLSGYRNKQALESGLDELRAAVEATKRRSVAQEEGSRWGMRFTNATSGISSYSVFQGSSYSTSGIDRTYSFRDPVGFMNPSASSTYDVVFAPLSGALSENKVFTLGGGLKGFIGDLILRTIGSITARTDQDVVGYWHLDEGTGTAAYDSSGYGNTGTLTNGPTWQSGTSCRAGGCLNLNGSTHYIQYGNVLNMGLDDWTISAWVNTTDSSLTNRYYLSKSRAAAQNYRYGLFISSSTQSGGIFMQGNGGADVAVSGNVAVNNGQWHHLVSVFDRDNNASLYIDGALNASGTISQWASANMVSNNPFRIGSYTASDNTTPTLFFPGSVDEFRVWSRALSASEIEALYNDLK